MKIIEIIITAIISIFCFRWLFPEKKKPVQLSPEAVQRIEEAEPEQLVTEIEEWANRD